MNNTPPSWHELYMRHVYLIASKSKEPRSRLGAVLVKDNRIISEGYNGLVRGANDDLPERWISPEKFLWIEHAERNVINNCAYHGVNSKDSTLYTNGIPCENCTRSLIQSGVTSIVLHKQWMDIEKQFSIEKWDQRSWRPLKMLEECGVGVIIYDKVLNLYGRLDSVDIKL